MELLDIAHQRLSNQSLSPTKFDKPEQVVSWLGAVQAQDYAAAKWAVGQRVKVCSDVDVEQAFANGKILRTHVLRPTWHFVTPDDIYWMLSLTAPRVHALNAIMSRKVGLNQAISKRSNAVLEKTLQGGKQLTRDELRDVLRQAGLPVDGEQRMSYLLMHAELEGLICSGGRRGKQFTYALLKECVPHGRSLARDEALAELTQRYFTSRGPATLQDFVWWSGLTMTDAKKGVEMIRTQLVQAVIDGQTYWFSPSRQPQKGSSPIAFLLPNYDEYVVGYTDRNAIFDGRHTDKLVAREGILTNVIVINGQVIGTWKRILKKNEVVIELNAFQAWTRTEAKSLVQAAEKYGKFLGLAVVLNH